MNTEIDVIKLYSGSRCASCCKARFRSIITAEIPGQNLMRL